MGRNEGAEKLFGKVVDEKSLVENKSVQCVIDRKKLGRMKERRACIILGLKNLKKNPEIL